MLSEFLEVELKERNRNLRSVLNEHTSKTDVETLGYKMSDFNQICLNKEDEKSIPLNRDVSKIAMVIDIKFGKDIRPDIRLAVKDIAAAHRQHAEAAIKALDGGEFEELYSDLKANICVVASFLGEKQIARIREIIKEYKDIKGVQPFKLYMNKLKTQSPQMKTFEEIFQGNIYLFLLLINHVAKTISKP